MYRSTRFENADSFQIKIPWDKYTARGFGIALVITAIIVALLPIMKIDPPTLREYISPNIPYEALNFGDGDGTGLSKGNLTPEGIKIEGPKSNNILEDAQKKAETRPEKNPVITGELADNMRPVDKLSSNDKSKDITKNGTDTKNLGDPNGSSTGTGLGDKGTGKGAGSGFGDIEWGGGGNRTVLHKPLPRFPDGVRTSASIKLQFKVLPDGTVSQVIPLQKADPRLEKAAIDALKRWRFNPLDDNRIMVGVIPLSFILK